MGGVSGSRAERRSSQRLHRVAGGGGRLGGRGGGWADVGLRGCRGGGWAGVGRRWTAVAVDRAAVEEEEEEPAG